MLDISLWHGVLFSHGLGRLDSFTRRHSNGRNRAQTRCQGQPAGGCVGGYTWTVPVCTDAVVGTRFGVVPPPPSPPFTYAPVPGNESASAPSSMGEVPQLLLVGSTLQGKYTCNNKATSTDISRPYGQTINATAYAVNYSGRSTTQVLPIKFDPCPHYPTRPVCEPH